MCYSHDFFTSNSFTSAAEIDEILQGCCVPLAHVRHDSFISYDFFVRVTWLRHMCDMTRSYVWHDSFICVTWLVHMCDMTRSYVWRVSFTRVTCLLHTSHKVYTRCVIGLLYAFSICVTCLIHIVWLLHMCNMTLSYMWHGSFICVTWLLHTCTMTPSHV